MAQLCAGAESAAMPQKMEHDGACGPTRLTA